MKQEKERNEWSVILKGRGAEDKSGETENTRRKKERKKYNKTAEQNKI